MGHTEFFLMPFEIEWEEADRILRSQLASRSNLPPESSYDKHTEAIGADVCYLNHSQGDANLGLRRTSGRPTFRGSFIFSAISDDGEQFLRDVAKACGFGFTRERTAPAR